MSDRKYYVRCESNCLYESMTKEQILAAIEQAVSTGEIKDVDSGFITTLKELNKNTGLKFWVGTQADYNALEEIEENCFYIITDETSVRDIEASIEKLRIDLEGLSSNILRYNKVFWEGDTNNIATQTDDFYGDYKEIPNMEELLNYSVIKIYTANFNEGYDTGCMALMKWGNEYRADYTDIGLSGPNTHRSTYIEINNSGELRIYLDSVPAFCSDKIWTNGGLYAYRLRIKKIVGVM